MQHACCTSLFSIKVDFVDFDKATLNAMFVETTHLIIRDLELEDLPALLRVSSDPDVVQAMDAYLPPDIAGLQQWLTETIRHNQQQPRVSHNCAIVLKVEGEVIGWIGFGSPDDPTTGDLGFGYALNRAYRNRGFVTEATKAMLAYCFDVIGVQTVIASYKRFNTASGRVMQKAGMRLHDALMPEGTDAGEIYYVITADDWRAHPNSS